MPLPTTQEVKLDSQQLRNKAITSIAVSLHHLNTEEEMPGETLWKQAEYVYEQLVKSLEGR